MSRFETGKQPCNNFNPQIEANTYAQWENEHQCYKCGGIVSYCLNCYRDHHENGYETCKKDTDTKTIRRRV